MNAIAVTKANLDLQHTVYLFDGFQLDVTRRKLISSGGSVQSLNSRAMDALLLLVANAGELVEKRRLMQTVWPHAVVEDNNLNQCVLAIRKALGETAGSNRYIMTVPGRGYRFVCPVRELAQESLADTAQVTTLRKPVSPVIWLSVATGACLLPIVIVLLRLALSPSRPSGSSETVPADTRSLQTLHLQLKEPIPSDGQSAVMNLTPLLAECLISRPDLALIVQVQLVTNRGKREWTGSFEAGIENSRSQTLADSPDDSACRSLIGDTTRR